MSEFSEECKRLIEKSSTNVYQIAKQSGLDRTTLQKMVQGKRLPSRQFVDDFSRHLAINKSEKERLDVLFRIEKIGKDVFRQRKEVAHLLRYFSAARKTMEDRGYQRKVRPESVYTDDTAAVRQVFLEVDIIDAIRYVIIRACDTSEETHIYMDSFDLAIYAMQQIIQEEHGGKERIVCHQFLKVERNPEIHGGGYNAISTLGYILPFAFSFRGTYDVNYAYVLSDDPTQNFALWPHYIVTDQHVLLLNDEGNGMLIENAEVARGYAEELRRRKSRCRPLFPLMGDPQWIMGYYAEIAENSKRVWPPESDGDAAGKTQSWGDGIDVELYEPDIIFFFAPVDEAMSCLCVEESGVFRVFRDYFESLNSEDYDMK